MTITEEICKKTPNLQKYYRIELDNSRKVCNCDDSYAFFSGEIKYYIYISKTIKHHHYYSSKKIKELITKKILAGSDLDLSQYNLLNMDRFNEIIKYIENYDYQEPLLTFEFLVSPIYEEILKNNAINNMKKGKEDNGKVEIADPSKYNGGYGITGEYLRIFQILSYFLRYQRITKENIVEWVYNYRSYFINYKVFNNPKTTFLSDIELKNLRMNHTVYEDFAKYELMECLDKIIDEGLYYPSSKFATTPSDFEKQILKQYENERKKLLQISEEVYQKKLTL